MPKIQWTGLRWLTGFPFLVITMGSPVSATWSISCRHLALNSDASTVFMLTPWS